MRQFYEEWQPYLITENHIQSIRPMLSGEIRIDLLAANRPTLSDDLDMDTWNSFLSIGFSHHYEIIIRAKTLEEREYFVDLLFFNRQLQSLIAIELKRGEFKPEYLGKMNFYLSALDDLVRLPHENRSIGIILCKSKKEKNVEYAFRDTSKPMGVSTYKLGFAEKLYAADTKL